MSQIAIVPSQRDDEEGLSTRPLTFKEQLHKFETISRLNQQNELRSIRNLKLKNNLRKLSLESQQMILNDQLTSRNASLSVEQARRDLVKIDEPPTTIDLLVESINRLSFDFYAHTCSGVTKNVVFSALPLYCILRIFHSTTDSGAIKEEITNALKTQNELTEWSNFINLFSLLTENFDNNPLEKENCNNLRCDTRVHARENYLLTRHVDVLKSSFNAKLTEQSGKLYENFAELEKLAGFDVPNAENATLEHLFMILTSQIDLKLDWKSHFLDSEDKGMFNRPNGGDIITINLMHIPKHRIMYCKNPQGLPVKVCEFPFTNEDYVFTIVLPEQNAIDQVEKVLTPALFGKIIEKMRLAEVSSALPKFLIEDRFDLVKVLAATGMGSLCDFSTRSDGLCVGKAFYSCSVSVNNSQVTVSSQTSVALCRDDRLSKKRVEHPCEDFICDNPFMFFIRNRRTNLILFMGKLTVPDQTN